MKQEIAQHCHTRPVLAQTKVAILPSPPSGACLGATTERRAQAGSFPSRPLPAPHSNRPGPSICRATATRNETTHSAASDQASHEMARKRIPLAPCSGAWFPRSRHYSTALPSSERYGKRYEVEISRRPVMNSESENTNWERRSTSVHLQDPVRHFWFKLLPLPKHTLPH
jgi:hypothetical protein